jgi:hypothetical protein
MYFFFSEELPASSAQASFLKAWTAKTVTIAVAVVLLMKARRVMPVPDVP